MALSRELARRPRVIMDLASRGIAGAVSLGRYNYTEARPALEDHVHRGAIEICFLVKGYQTYTVGGRSYRLTGGDVFLAFPGEHHSTGGLPEEKGILYWMVLRTARGRERFLGLPETQARDLRDALLGLPVRHFRGSWTMKEHLDRISDLFHRKPDPLTAFAIANRTGAFLLEVIGCGRAPSRRKQARSLKPVTAYIRAHLDEPLSVERLADVAGLSVSRFKGRFKEEVGVPPAEYVMRQRVLEAEHRLKRGKESVTRIAHDLVFSTSQYFATVFKRFSGRSPSEFGKGSSRRRHD